MKKRIGSKRLPKGKVAVAGRTSKLPTPIEAPELSLPEAYEQWAEGGDKVAQEWVEANNVKREAAGKS